MAVAAVAAVIVVSVATGWITWKAGEMARATSAEKPGWQTSEFWLALALLVAATALRLTQKIDADAWMVVAGGIGVSYPVSRGIAKR